jgi:hypothetical protein
VSISAFGKPTYTDTLNPYASNHPIQQKYAAVRFLYNRLNSYHLQDKEHQEEKTLSRVYYIIIPSQYKFRIPLTTTVHIQKNSYKFRNPSTTTAHNHKTPRTRKNGALSHT